METITYYHCEELEIIHIKDHPKTYGEHNHVSTYTVGLVMNGRVTLIVDGKPPNSRILRFLYYAQDVRYEFFTESWRFCRSKMPLLWSVYWI